MKTEYVSSGSFVVSKKRDCVLKACLGTCVGVTLVDKKAGLGGMIHILLSEPSNATYRYPDETYASTGMPKFIRAMYDAGASRESMEACVAGGALVGPVSKTDFTMDIGGKTTETVLDILEQESIPVVNMEAGGYFACKLILSLKDLKSWIEPIIDKEKLEDRPFEKPSMEEITRAIKKVRPIPQVVLKILRMVQMGDYDIGRIGKEIRQDQVITARIIKWCNSPAMGLRVEVSSVDRALVVLGEKRLIQVILSIMVERMFPDTVYGYSLCKGGMFKHALGTAHIAMELSGLTGHTSPDVAYTAGLLHDIGKIPLDQYVTRVAPYFYRSVNEDGEELLKTEEATFGISHTEVGYLLGKKWGLPKDLNEVIRYHHFPEKEEKHRDLVTLIYLSDLLSSRFQTGLEMDRLNTDRFAERLNFIGLDLEGFYNILSSIDPSIFNIDELVKD